MSALGTIALVLGTAWFLATTFPLLFWILIVPLTLITFISIVMWLKK